jgi:hypothetical protein
MVLFDLTAFDSVVYDGLTQWLREKVAASPEYQALNGKAIDAALGGKPGDAPFDDEMPF